VGDVMKAVLGAEYVCGSTFVVLSGSS